MTKTALTLMSNQGLKGNRIVEYISRRQINRAKEANLKIRLVQPIGYLNLGRFMLEDVDYTKSQVAIGGTVKYLVALRKCAA